MSIPKPSAMEIYRQISLPEIDRQFSKPVSFSNVDDRSVTPQSIAQSIKAIPSVQNVEIYPHGSIRGDIISLGDKPAGQEAGILFYVRDANYYAALADITPKFQLIKPGQNIKIAAAALGNSKTLQKIYQQFIDKYHREKAHGLKDIEGSLYQELFAQYDKIVQHCKNTNLNLKEANAFFYLYFLEQSLKTAQSQLEAIKTSPFNMLEKLEEAFNTNPLLFALYADEIEARNKSVPESAMIMTHMLKLDYANSKSVVYEGRLASSNTAKKAGIKAYYKSLKENLTKLELNQDKKQALLEAIKLKFQEKAAPSAKRKDIEALIRANISSPNTLLAKAEEAYDKARLSSVRLKHFAKKAEASLINSDLKVSIDALREQLATEHASRSGLKSQDIQTVLGTALNNPGMPQLKLVSLWNKEFLTFEELSQGATINDKSFPPIEFAGGESPNPLSESSYMCFKLENPNGGSPIAVSASHLFPLGRHLALFLTHNDRDAVGKAGQNKGLTVSKTGDTELFGIDFGHSFEKKLEKSKVQDDFSFEQRGWGDINNLVNMASFYDTPYVEKMEGIHLLAKQCGFPVSEQAKTDFETIWNNPNIKKGSHLEPFKKQRNHYLSLIEKNEYEIKILEAQLSTPSNLSSQDISSRKQEANNLNEKNKHYKTILKSINEMQKTMEENNQVLFKTFSKRINLTKAQLGLLDGLEKLVSEPTRTSLNGQVLLNHLRVERKNRIPFQFDMYKDEPLKGELKTDEEGCYTLLIQGKDKQKNQEALSIIKDYVKNHPEVELFIENNPPAIRFKVEQEEELFKAFTEDNVANYLGLSTPIIQQILTRARAYNPNMEPGENTTPEVLSYAIPLKLNTPAALKRVKPYPVLTTLGIDPYHLILKLNEKEDLVVVEKGVEVKAEDYIKNRLNGFREDLCLMSELPLHGVPAEGNVYLEKHGDKLKYLVVSPQKKKVEGELDISIDGELSSKVLRDKKSEILALISKRGHINPSVRMEVSKNISMDLQQESLVIGEGFEELNQVIKLAIQHTSLKDRSLSHKAWREQYFLRKISEKKSYEDMRDWFKGSREENFKNIKVIEENIKAIVDGYKEKLSMIYASQKLAKIELNKHSGNSDVAEALKEFIMTIRDQEANIKAYINNSKDLGKMQNFLKNYIHELESQSYEQVKSSLKNGTLNKLESGMEQLTKDNTKKEKVLTILTQIEDDNGTIVKEISKKNAIKNALSDLGRESSKISQEYEKQVATLYLAKKYTQESIKRYYPKKYDRQAMLLTTTKYFEKEKKELQLELKRTGFDNPQNTPLAKEIKETEAFFKEHESLSFEQLHLELQKKSRSGGIDNLSNIANSIPNVFGENRKKSFETIMEASTYKKEFLTAANKSATDNIRSKQLPLSAIVAELQSIEQDYGSIGIAGQLLLKENIEGIEVKVDTLEVQLKSEKDIGRSIVLLKNLQKIKDDYLNERKGIKKLLQIKKDDLNVNKNISEQMQFIERKLFNSAELDKISKTVFENMNPLKNNLSDLKRFMNTAEGVFRSIGALGRECIANHLDVYNERLNIIQTQIKEAKEPSKLLQEFKTKTNEYKELRSAFFELAELSQNNRSLIKDKPAQRIEALIQKLDKTILSVPVIPLEKDKNQAALDKKSALEDTLPKGSLVQPLKNEANAAMISEENHYLTPEELKDYLQDMKKRKGRIGNEGRALLKKQLLQAYEKQEQAKASMGEETDAEGSEAEIASSRYKDLLAVADTFIQKPGFSGIIDSRKRSSRDILNRIWEKPVKTVPSAGIETQGSTLGLEGENPSPFINETLNPNELPVPSAPPAELVEADNIAEIFKPRDIPIPSAPPEEDLPVSDEEISFVSERSRVNSTLEGTPKAKQKLSQLEKTQLLSSPLSVMVATLLEIEKSHGTIEANAQLLLKEKTEGIKLKVDSLQSNLKREKDMRRSIELLTECQKIKEGYINAQKGIKNLLQIKNADAKVNKDIVAEMNFIEDKLLNATQSSKISQTIFENMNPLKNNLSDLKRFMNAAEVVFGNIGAPGRECIANHLEVYNERLNIIEYQFKIASGSLERSKLLEEFQTKKHEYQTLRPALLEIDKLSRNNMVFKDKSAQRIEMLIQKLDKMVLSTPMAPIKTQKPKAKPNDKTVLAEPLVEASLEQPFKDGLNVVPISKKPAESTAKEVKAVISKNPTVNVPTAAKPLSSSLSVDKTKNVNSQSVDLPITEKKSEINYAYEDDNLQSYIKTTKQRMRAAIKAGASAQELRDIRLELLNKQAESLDDKAYNAIEDLIQWNLEHLSSVERKERRSENRFNERTAELPKKVEAKLNDNRMNDLRKNMPINQHKSVEKNKGLEIQNAPGKNLAQKESSNKIEKPGLFKRMGGFLGRHKKKLLAAAVVAAIVTASVFTFGGAAIAGAIAGAVALNAAFLAQMAAVGFSSVAAYTIAGGGISLLGLGATLVFDAVKGLKNKFKGKEEKIETTPQFTSPNRNSSPKINQQEALTASQALRRRAVQVQQEFQDIAKPTPSPMLSQYNAASNSSAFIKTLSARDKTIIANVVLDRQEKGEANRYYDNKDGFNIIGPNPVSIVSEAQMRGATALPYTLSAKTAAEALRIIETNQRTLAQQGKKSFVNITEIKIAGKHYATLAAFMDAHSPVSPSPSSAPNNPNGSKRGHKV